MNLRPATAADAELLRSWRNDLSTRAASHQTAAVGVEEHRAWLAAALADPARTLWVAEDDIEPVGTVRVDRRPNGERQLSWTVAPSARGRGVGSAIVAMAITAMGPGPVTAEVKTGNRASCRIAEKCGFVCEREEDGVRYYRYLGDRPV